MVSRRFRLLLTLGILIGLGGCVAYEPSYGHGYGGGHYAAAPVYVAPTIRYGGGGWWGGYRHHHHRRDW